MKRTLAVIIAFCMLAGIAAAEIVEFEIGDYNIEDVGNGYEIITATNLFLGDSFLYGMALPEGVVLKKFSQNQPIDEISLIEFMDPIDITLNMPAVETDANFNDMYVNRICYSDTREPEFFVNDPIITGNEAQYSIQITPIEITDCEAGDFILYRKVSYEIKKHVSPIRIQRVFYTPSSAPGETTVFQVELNHPADGVLKLMDDLDEEVDSVNLSNEDKTSFSIELSSSNDITEYTVEYWEDEKLISFMNAEVATEWGNVDFEVYVSDDDFKIPVKVYVTNNLDEAIDVDLTFQLTDWDSNLDLEMKESRKAVPGKNTYSVTLEVEEGMEQDDLLIMASYNGDEKIVLHNTIMRINPESAKAAQDAYQNKLEEGTEPTAKSNLIGIVVAIALFGLLIYFAVNYIGERE